MECDSMVTAISSLMPRPSTRAKRVHTCEEGLSNILVTRSGADLGFEMTNQTAEDVIMFA